jgi:predicted dehydrogenase
MIVYDDMEPSEKLRIYDAGVTITPALSQDEIHGQVVVYRAGDMWVPKVDTREALAVQAEHIVDCIRTGSRPLADGHAGLRVVQVLELAQQALSRDLFAAERSREVRGVEATVGRG